MGGKIDHQKMVLRRRLKVSRFYGVDAPRLTAFPCRAFTGLQARVLSIRTGVRYLRSLRQASFEWKPDDCRENTHVVKKMVHRASYRSARAGFFFFSAPAAADS